MNSTNRMVWGLFENEEISFLIREVTADAERLGERINRFRTLLPMLCLEASSPVLLALAERCLLNGHRDPETAKSIGEMTVYGMANADPGWCAVALEQGAMKHVAVINRELISSSVFALLPMVRTVGVRVDSVTVCPYGEAGEFALNNRLMKTAEEAFSAVVSGDYADHKIHVSAARKIPFLNQWLYDEPSFPPSDEPFVFFEGLSKALSDFGLSGMHTADISQFAKRNYEANADRLTIELIRAVARDQNYLPGLKTLWLVERLAKGLFEHLAETELMGPVSRLIDHLRAEGQTSREINDPQHLWDHYAFAPDTNHPNHRLLAIGDQNCDFLIEHRLDTDDQIVEMIVKCETKDQPDENAWLDDSDWKAGTRKFQFSIDPVTGKTHLNSELRADSHTFALWNNLTADLKGLKYQYGDRMIGSSSPRSLF